MRVFVSSTFTDLREYRQAAHDGIVAAGHLPAMMEFMGASPKTPQEIINEELKSIDVHVALLGKRYGSLMPGQNVSWTEYEILKAAELGKLGLVYIVDHASSSETGTYAAEAFRAHVAESSVARVVSSPSELRYAIERDLSAVSSASPVETETESILLPGVSPADIRTLLKHPEELQKCSPRFFEELVADLLKADGWEVDLVARNNAPGPDIIAVSSQLVRGVPLKLIVECKRHSSNHPVDINVVRKVMYWVNEEYRATMGMIATTSRFTADALQHAREYHEWRLDLRDQTAVVDWLIRQRRSSDA